MARPRRSPGRPARAADSAAPAAKTRAGADGRARRRSRRTSKISITVDAEVLQEIERLIRDTGTTLSAHITEALERDLRRRRLQQLIADFEAEKGEITEEELAEIRAQWQA